MSDNNRKIRRIMSTLSLAQDLSEALNNPDVRDEERRRQLTAGLDTSLNTLHALLTDLGECPLCGQEYEGLLEDEAQARAEGWVNDPLALEDDSYGWSGRLAVEDVNGIFRHEVDRVSSIGKAVETLYNLYQAGVEDTQPEFQNPPLHEAVAITVRLTKEVF